MGIEEAERQRKWGPGCSITSGDMSCSNSSTNVSDCQLLSYLRLMLRTFLLVLLSSNRQTFYLNICCFLYRSSFSSWFLQTFAGLDCHMIIRKKIGHGLTMAHLNCEFLIPSDSNPPLGIERVVCKGFSPFLMVFLIFYGAQK